MKYFGTQTNYLLDKSKPYQRPELRHAGPTSVNREAELDRPSRVACSDFLLGSSGSTILINLIRKNILTILRTPTPLPLFIVFRWHKQIAHQDINSALFFGISIQRDHHIPSVNINLDRFQRSYRLWPSASFVAPIMRCHHKLLITTFR